MNAPVSTPSHATPSTHHACCGCGALRFSSTSAPILQLVCHCQQCRAVSKRASTPLAFFKVKDATIQGDVRRESFVADSGHVTARECCAACGDMLIDRTEGFPRIVGVVADRLAAPFVFVPKHHVWAQSKVAGTALPNDVPVYDDGGPV